MTRDALSRKDGEVAAVAAAGGHDADVGAVAAVCGGCVVGGVPVVPRPALPGAARHVRLLGGRRRGLSLRALPIRQGER